MSLSEVRPRNSRDDNARPDLIRLHHRLFCCYIHVLNMVCSSRQRNHVGWRRCLGRCTEGQQHAQGTAVVECEKYGLCCYYTHVYVSDSLIVLRAAHAPVMAAMLKINTGLTSLDLSCERTINIIVRCHNCASKRRSSTRRERWRLPMHSSLITL